VSPDLSVLLPCRSEPDSRSPFIPKTKIGYLKGYSQRVAKYANQEFNGNTCTRVEKEMQTNAGERMSFIPSKRVSSWFVTQSLLIDATAGNYKVEPCLELDSHFYVIILPLDRSYDTV
jgi:hypothetical protein